MVRYPNPIVRKMVNSEAWRKCINCRQRIEIGEEYFYVVPGFQSFCISCFDNLLSSSAFVVFPEHYWDLALELWRTQKRVEELEEELKLERRGK